MGSSFSFRGRWVILSNLQQAPGVAQEYHHFRNIFVSLFLIGAASGFANVRGQAFTYRFINQDISNVNFASASWGDLNRDGKYDLVVSGLTSGQFPSPFASVYINLREIGSTNAKGDSVWTQEYQVQGQGIVPVWMSTVSWMDVDNDGGLEFILAGARKLERPYNPVTTIYKLSGSSFVPMDNSIEGVYGGSIDWGDYDNDGDVDFVMTGETDSGPLTSLYENDGGGSFHESDVGLLDVSLGDARFGDYDTDGDLDILLTGDTGAGFVTELYRNDGGVFTEVPVAFPGLAFSAVDWGDYDNDGDPDVLLAGGTLSPLILDGHSYVFRNDGGGSFTDIGADLDGLFYGAAKWGDYDNDGLLDILLSGATNIQQQRLGRLYHNEGGGVFRVSINLAGLFFSEAALGDYDGDGDVDVLQVGEGVTSQYRNDQLRVNDPPEAPSGLRTTGAADAVTLAWDPAFDAQTPATGLSYNIRVGTAPGALDVVNPLAQLSTGRRLINGLGNVRQNTSWTLRALSAGTYFWAVQAIDNAFNGSPFSEEGSFTVSSTGGVTTGVAPTETIDDFRLVSTYPNPFAAETIIEFSTSNAVDVELAIYNPLGERVRLLARGPMSAGTHRVTWNGNGVDGSRVGAGFYLVRLTDGTRQRILKVVKVL